MIAIYERRRRKRTGEEFDRRSYPRVRLALEGFFFGKNRALDFREGNLTLRGLYIKTRFPEPAGSRAVVRLCAGKLPTMLKIDVEVVWSNDDPSHAAPGMGLRFCELACWQRKRLAACLLRRAGLRAFPSLEKKTIF